MYIHERKDWPNFRWDNAKLAVLLAEVRHLQGKVLGRMERVGFSLREDATLRTLTEDVVKTSAIENENLNKEHVRSSIARRLGIDIGGSSVRDRNVDGIVEVMLDATCNYKKELNKNRLFGWHGALFPTGRSGFNKIVVGKWRTQESGTMEVVSGAYGREKIHYEAPDYSRVKKEMDIFIKWFEQDCGMDMVLKSALAHFWFVTIHPFDDGNGRIARAIADMQLARCEESKQRFYSMSSQIQKDRKGYYDILERSQKGNLEITDWMEWFLVCLKRAIISSADILEIVLRKSKFWEMHLGGLFNIRQKKMINMLLDGFEGKMTSSKWASIAKCSQDTSIRDIKDLVERNILIKDPGGGRSTSYSLNV